jgi:hypothetical protein
VFHIDGVVTSAFAHLAGDDWTDFYMNGVEQNGTRGFAAALVPGENVIAVKVRNATGPAGLIFFGEVVLADGRKVLLRSDRTFRSSPTASEGWEKIGFDDADWAPAREQGDVTMSPFANYRDYTQQFATAAEREKIKAVDREFDDALPPGLADEPHPSAKIIYEGNLPKVEVNGRRYEPWFNLVAAGCDYAWNQAVKLNALGVKFHRISVTEIEYEKAPGVYDFSRLDLYARQVLKFVPDAFLTITIKITPPKWLVAHPEALVRYGDGEIGSGGGDELSGRVARPSPASPEYRAEAARLIAQLGAYVCTQPWGKRVVAIRPCWGVYTEWHMYGFYHSPDVGVAMTEAFQRFKGGKYANENPPTVEERTHGGRLLDPVKDAKTIDYFECLQTEVADFLTFTARETKRAFPGRLVGMYYGYVLTTHPPEGANVMLDKVLAVPEIDFLSDPAIYTPESRRAGGAYSHRTIPATFHRFGKMPIIEDDMRFHHVIPVLSDSYSKSYAAQTPRESRMTMRRNLINGIFDGAGIQFCDPIALRGGRFCAHDDPAVLTGFYEAAEVRRQVGAVPVDSSNDTAIVADWRECLRQDNKAFMHEDVRLLYAHGPTLAYRSGAAFDMLSLDDFLAAKKSYAKVVFLNIFNPSAHEVQALRAKTAHAASVRIVLPGAAKEVFSSATRILEGPPKDEQGWRDIFASIGTHLYAPVGNYVRRHGDLVMFHTANAGEHSLIPPDDLAGKDATELFSGRVFSGTEFRFKTEGCDTLLLKFAGNR